jgi:curved DNA-binding protein CbpA
MRELPDDHSSLEKLGPESNPYVWLGFFPDEAPTDDEVKIRFRRLALIHHPDLGGVAKTFQTILDAYQCISSASNPGFAHFYSKRPGHQRGGVWRQSDNGNMTYRLHNQLVGTVYRRGEKWGWVADGKHSKQSYPTIKEAMEGFLSR